MIGVVSGVEGRTIWVTWCVVTLSHQTLVTHVTQPYNLDEDDNEPLLTSLFSQSTVMVF